MSHGNAQVQTSHAIFRRPGDTSDEDSNAQRASVGLHPPFLQTKTIIGCQIGILSTLWNVIELEPPRLPCARASLLPGVSMHVRLVGGERQLLAL